MISSEKLSYDYLEVNSCARQYLSNRDYTMVRPNGRVDYHFLYITQGKCMVYLENDIATTVEAGNIIFFSPNTPQKYTFLGKDNSISNYIHFSGTECKNLLKKANLYDKRIIYVGLSEELDRIFERLVEEYNLKKSLYSEISSALLQQFIITAGRLADKGNRDNSDVNSPIDVICLRIHEQYNKNMPISYYAELAHLSESRFTHVFKEQMGVSPKEYIQKVKVDMACGLLRYSTLPLIQISEIIGMKDYNYFCRLIKKHTNKTPSDLRNNVTDD